MAEDSSNDMYKNGKIYKLIANDKCYIGSTCTPLVKRKAKHKADYVKWKRTGKGYMSSFDVFEEAELLNIPVAIILLEDCPVDRREQLLCRERWHIENTPCVNRYIPTRTAHERYTNNRENIIAYQMKRYHDNKEDWLEKSKQRYHKKRAELLEELARQGSQDLPVDLPVECLDGTQE